MPLTFPTVMVFNKIDSLEAEDELQVLRSRYLDALPVSAQHGDGIEKLMEALANRLLSAVLCSPSVSLMQKEKRWIYSTSTVRCLKLNTLRSLFM